MSYATALDLGDNTFLAYVIALFVSGGILLVLALAGFGASTGSRILSGLFGLGFVGYSVYLAFFFDGGEYRIFIYAFIVPILLIVNVVKSRKANQEASAQASTPPPPAA